MRSPVPRLRFVLRLNAAFSGLCALVSFFGAVPLAGEVGLSTAELRGLGVQLALFAAFLAFLSARSALGRGWTYWAVLALGVLDLLWVAGSAQALRSGALAASALGGGVVLAVALVVGAFGCLELWIWWALRGERRRAATRRAQPAG